MSVLVERSMGDLNKEKAAVYPLFQKGATPQPPPPRKRASKDNLKPVYDANISEHDTKNLSKRKSQKAKPNTIDLLVHDGTVAPDQEGTKEGELLEVDPNNNRRKRRKIAPDGKGKLLKHDGASVGSTIPIEDQLSHPKEITSRAVRVEPSPGMAQLLEEGILRNLDTKMVESLGTASIAGTQSEPLIQGTTELGPPGPEDNDMHQPPRKVLRLNAKTGTIGSPPARKSHPTTASTRKKTTSSRVQTKSKVVTFRYGDGQPLPLSIGEKIDQILSGVLLVSPIEKPKPVKVVKRSPPKPTKSTHPFFLVKPAVKDCSPTKSTTPSSCVIDLTGPDKSIAQLRTQVTSHSRPRSPVAASVPFFGFGSSAKITKFPGAVESAWPCKDMVHVRGLGTHSEATQQSSISAMYPVSRGKKEKYQAVQIEHSENILNTLAKELCVNNIVNNIRDVDPNEFLPVPECLRIPKKHLESGPDVQRRVYKELRTRPHLKGVAEDSSEDETNQSTPDRAPVHPAISKTYNLVSGSLSAFDRGACEILPWTQKYAPKFATDVLQTGRDVLILRDWLQSLTVKAVEGGPGNENEASMKMPSTVKRKRKTKKLDDFVVSDDDIDEMEEISDVEVESALSANRNQLRTIFRRGDPTKGAGRTVVISGPPGCGKTAAVYAVAKELGFEVFELNPGSRRNGKDILDRVGDMAHNHQVQRVSGLIPTDGAADEDRRKIDEALANDLKTGRQGTMNSFFKSSALAKPTAQPKATTEPLETASVLPKQQTLVNKPIAKSRGQKQSLILIEEADILYKEDTQFWSTIQELIRTSKRPVIITCNDEFPIPLGILPLQAIIRMRAPPLDLAVDYMLLVAGCEGHVIQREAVTTLYQNRGMDLRAALTDLNYWCQFGVGDQKNGLNWYLTRRPSDIGQDKSGTAIRVISEATYQVGMGLLCQDTLESQMHNLRIEEETLHEACDGWNLDLGNWQETLDMEPWAQEIRRQSGVDGHRASLQAYEEFAEAMSGADLCSDGLFLRDNQVSIDTSLPELTTKSRDDFTLACRLLEASTTVTYDFLGKEISLWMKSRIRDHLQVAQHVRMDAEVPIQLSRPVEADFLRMIQSLSISSSSAIGRRDFSNAFDPISYPEKTSFSNSDRMEMSVFDRTTRIISEDMAPYVRSIVDCDSRLQADREKLSNLVSEGGRKGKRMRTTRAAISALEGGARSTTRKERYFGSLLNPYVVMRTGLQTWTEAAREEMGIGRSRRPSTADSKDPLSENEEAELIYDKRNT